MGIITKHDRIVFVEVLEKIFKQTFWQVLGKVVTVFSSVLILGIISRNYKEAGTGIITLAITYLSIFYLLVDFGFNAHELKRFNSSDINPQSELRKLFGVRFVWSILLTVAAVSLLPFWSFSKMQFEQSVLFGSLAIISTGFFATCNLFFQYKVKYELSVVSSVFGVLVNLLLVWIFALYNLPVPFLLLAYLAGSAATTIIALFFLGSYKVRITPLFDFKYLKSLTKQSWPIAATLALNVVYFRADSFMIASFRGLSDAGIYNVAYSIFQSTLVLPSFIMNAYYPLMLKSFKHTKSVALGLFFLSVLGTVLTLILAPFVIGLITGKGFEGSSLSLQILSLGFPAYFMSSLLMWVLVTKNMYKKMLFIYAVGLLFNLTTNFVYIPKFSYLAASSTTVISEYLILLLQLFFLKGLLDKAD